MWLVCNLSLDLIVITVVADVVHLREELLFGLRSDWVMLILDDP